MNMNAIFIRPAWRSQWLSLVFLVLFTIVYFGNTDPFISPYILGILGFILYRILINRFYTKYMIGPKGVEIHEGIISQNMTRFEYRHIRGANMKATIMNRIMGIGHITLSTSGMDDDIEIKNIKKPRYYTDLIITQLKDLS